MSLAAGSIAFTGFNADGADNLAFVVLEPIAAGTEIWFTDNEWTGGAFNTGESTWTWTAASNIAAGTIVTMDGLAAGETATSNLGTIAWAEETARGLDSFTHSGFLAGETVYAYVGTASSPTFLAAFTTGAFTSADAGLISGTGLSTGLTARATQAEDDIAAYTGIRLTGGDFSNFLSLVNGTGTWATQYDKVNDNSADGTAPDVPFSTDAFVIDPLAQRVAFATGSLTVSQVEGNSGETTYSFVVERTNGTTGAVEFTGTFARGTTAAADYAGGKLPATTFTGTIPEGETSATITIAIAAETTYEADESFSLTLTKVTNPAATVYLEPGAADLKATGTIVNDDTQQLIGFAAGSTNVSVVSEIEGTDGTRIVTFTVERSGNGGTVGDVAFSGTFAAGTTNAEDFGGTLPTTFSGIIPDGEISTTVSIAISGDAAIETNERFTLTLTTATNPAAQNVALGVKRSEGWILNDDGPTVVHAGETVSQAIGLTGPTTLTIEAGGTVAGGFSVAGSDVDVTIDNAGLITEAGIEGNGTGRITINNAESGIISDQIKTPVFTAGAGLEMTINNAGTITGGHKSIRAEDIYYALLTINNLATGVINSGADNASGIQVYGDAIINNAGKIIVPFEAGKTSAGKEAIEFSDTGVTLNNLAGGWIEGSHHAFTGDEATTVVNELGGTMIGRNGSAVNIDNDAAAEDTVTVVNRGLMQGLSQNYADSDGDAIDVDGRVVVDNWGTIEGLGHNGYHKGEPNVSEAIAAGAAIITNHEGGTLYGFGRAIQIDNSANGDAFAASTITNSGLIKGDGNLPTGVTEAEVAAFAGLIHGGEAINIVGNKADSINNTATGTIVGGIKAGGGNDTLVNDGSMTATGGSAVDLGDGDDLFVNRGTVTGDVLAGAGNDEIINVATGNIFGGVVMGDGNDKLGNSGLVGGDVDMGDGDDVVNLYVGASVGGAVLLGSGNDLLTATAYGDFVVDAGDGDDTVAMGDGDDDVQGGAGNDMLYGGGGDDVVAGGDGDDYIQGNAGDDELLGGAGDDTLLGGAGDDTIDGGDGSDTADYAFDQAGITVDFAAGTVMGDDAGYDTLIEIEKVIGGAGDDLFIVAAEGSVPAGIDGGAGDDTLRLVGTAAGSLESTAASGLEHLVVASGQWNVGQTAGFADIAVETDATVTRTIYLTGSQRLVVEEGATVDGQDSLAVLTTGTLTGVSVDNSGTIKGIAYNVAGAGPGPVTIVNQASGLIQGPGGGVTLKIYGGAINQDAPAVQNFGTIVGSTTTSTIAIDFESVTGTGARIVNEAGGLITTVAYQDVIRGGKGTVVENHGTIISGADQVLEDGELLAGGDGIDYKKLSGGLVHNFEGGLIEASRHGVTGKYAVTVINDAGATIVGRNGSAVNIDNTAGESNAVTVVNRGTLEGRSQGYEDSDGDAIDTDGLLILDNYGAIRGLGANGYHNGEPNVSEGIAIGGGTIRNYAGATIYGYGRAIQVDNSENGPALAATSIVNDGTLQGDGHGPENVAPEDAARFDLRGNEAINLVGSYADSLFNSATGQIVGGVAMGGGNDTLSNDGSITATGGSAVNMGEGDDLIVNRAIITGDVLLGAGADELINQSTGVITGDVTFGDGNDKLGNTGKIVGTVDLGAGDDFVNIWIGSDIQGQILLGDGNDILISNDWISTNMEIDGGAGNDEIYTSFGNDTVHGGDGNDRIYANQGNDTVYGDAGNDEIYGQAGDDMIDGGDGDDLLIGGDGADTLTGGLGDDVLRGGAGNDTIDGGAGYDVLDLSDATGAVTVNYATGTASGGGIGTDTFSGIESILFGAGADQITGSNGDDTIDGGAGNDTIKGGNGDDTLSGGEGDDNIDGGSGDDIVNGGVGNDTLKGGSGNDVIAAGDGNDSVDAGSGDDTVNGGLGNDTLKGGSGADVIIGDAGDDILTGGSGADVFVFAAGFGHDSVTDFTLNGSSADLLQFSTDVFADFADVMSHSAQVGGSVVVTLDADNSITLANVQMSSLTADDFRFV
jgi:Ca2+-binding RTX toxin-like protein